jgi:hypothetical protein
MSNFGIISVIPPYHEETESSDTISINIPTSSTLPTLPTLPTTVPETITKSGQPTNQSSALLIDPKVSQQIRPINQSEAVNIVPNNGIIPIMESSTNTKPETLPESESKLNINKLLSYVPFINRQKEPTLTAEEINAKTKVTLYDGLDICSSRQISMDNGPYTNSTLRKVVLSRGFNPVIAKIEPLTTLVLYTGDNMSGLSRVYNNPYDDRYVVVKLDQKNPIVSMEVKPFEITKEQFTLDETGIFVSTTDLIMIIIAIALIMLIMHKI